MAGAFSRRTLLAAASSAASASILTGSAVGAETLTHDADLLATKLASALKHDYPGTWVVSVCPDRGFVLIHKIPETA